MRELPGSVLFACTQNAIRSPMAENIMKYLHGRRVFVQSAGVRAGELDPFAVAVMDEIGIDIVAPPPAQLRASSTTTISTSSSRCRPRPSTARSS